MAGSRIGTWGGLLAACAAIVLPAAPVAAQSGPVEKGAKILSRPVGGKVGKGRAETSYRPLVERLEAARDAGNTDMVATLLPIVSNGLGIREWVIGILAPMISHEPVSTSQAIVAELVHQARDVHAALRASRGLPAAVYDTVGGAVAGAEQLALLAVRPAGRSHDAPPRPA